MKKTFILIIALCVVGLTVAYSQDMARINQIQAEVERITNAAEARGGTYTPQELQRVQQLQQEMYQLLGMTPMTADQALQQVQQIDQMNQRSQQQQQQALQFPGVNRGWIPAAALNFVGLSSLRQPAGTNASYDNHNNWDEFSIHLTGGNPETVVQELKRQIETATRQQMQVRTGDVYGVRSVIYTLTVKPHPNRSYRQYEIELTMSISSEAWRSAQADGVKLDIVSRPDVQ